MIRSKLHILYALIAAWIVGLGSTALAAPLSVGNASFEEPDLSEGATWTNDLSASWTLGSETAGNAFIERIEGFAAEAAQHIGLAENDYITQDTGIAVEPNTTYTLRVGVGNRNESFSPAGAMAIIGLANAVPAAANANEAVAALAASTMVDSGPPQAESTFVDASVSFTTGAEVEGNVVIFLGDDVSGGRSHFDNVRLDATPAYIVNKAAGTIVADGDLSDWSGANEIVNPEFTITTEEALSPFGQRVTHEEFGGTWDGASDHSATVMALYDDESIYLAIVVTDDYHENAANSAWNGDSAQLMIASGARDAQVALYNYAVGGVEGALGDQVIMHEARPEGGSDTTATVTRDGTTTTYEICIPKDAAGLADLVEGTPFGFAVSINDGDEATPGQKGWSGVEPGALVRNKNPELSSLFILGAPPAPPNLAEGLVNYWSLDSNLDDLAHGVAGTASSSPDNGVFDGANGTDGVAYSGGIFGDSIELNGATGDNQNDGYVRIARSGDTLFGANATNPSAPNTVTTSMWVKVTGNDTSWQTILSHGEGAQYRFARRDATVTNAAYAGGSGDIPTANGVGPDLSGGDWHHVLGISEGGVSTRLWVDGELVATGDAPVIDDARSGGALDLLIGANPDTGDQNREWFGGIDDVAQWNRALSDSEIAMIWNGGAGASVGTLAGLATTPLIACWSFDGNPNDDVAGIPGTASAGLSYSNDAVRGKSMTGGSVAVTEMSVFNEAGAADQLSVSFWQKNTGTPSSSSVWFRSPTTGDRAFQAHVPWSNSILYFDTAGCCNPPQRINANPTGFNGFAWDDGQFHHYAFVKDGENKQIYIDGVLFLDQSAAGVPAAALPADMNGLWIGSGIDGASQFAGFIDDFAVWGGALTAKEVGELAAGANPKTLGGRVDLGPDPDLDGLTDSWEIANLGNTDSGADDDNDGDGQTNKEEFRNGTNPAVADSDGDGLSDGEEEALGINPLSADTDGDGLSDSFEVSYGTWPGQVDTDGDGYTDAQELCFVQDFQVADGTTDLGDGSIVSNNQREANPGAGSVQGGALQLTEDNVNSQAADYKLPATFGGLAANGFKAVFDLTLFDAAGDNPPADGFSFNFGAIADDASAGEEGHADGLVVSFDTWDNGGDEAAEGDSGTGIGVDVKVAGGANIAINRIDPSEDKNANSIFNFDNVARKVEITYTGNGTDGFVSVSLGGNVLHSNVPVPWAPEAGDRIAFGARTGGANEQVTFDNLGITCAATGDPLSVISAPAPPTITALSVRNIDAEDSANLDGFIAGPLTDGSKIISEVTVEAGNINYNDDAGTQGFPGDRAFPVYGVKGGHDFTGLVGTGTINVPTAGFWTFRTRSDDGSILRINGMDVVDDRGNHGAQNRHGAIELTAGEHTFEYLFYEQGGGSSCELGVALVVGDHTDGTTASESDGGVPYVLLNNPNFVLADSARDFAAVGGIQGSLGWQYGLQVGDGSSFGDFEAFAADWWNGTAWDEPNADGDNVPWTLIGDGNVHPNGDNNGVIHQVVRRWNSSYEGPVNISWTLAKQNVNCGNGVTGGVALNGEVLDSATIAGDDGVGVSRIVSASLAVGDTVDLFQNSLGVDGGYNDGCDGTFDSMQVTPALPVVAGLCQEWWQNGNPGNRADVEAVFADRAADNVFKGTDNGGTGTWWTGNGGAIPGVQAYPPATTLARDNYVTRLTGEIYFPEDGEYKFKDGIDDYTFLFIDLNGNGVEDEGEVLIDDNTWTGTEGNQNGGSPIVSAAATAGWVDIVMYAAEGGGGDAGVLYWDYSEAGVGTGVGFPTGNEEAIDLAANGAGLIVPDGNLRCATLPPADCDGDGILDSLELAWFGDLSQDLNDDSDGDRSINADEIAMGTDPTVKDTDGDGLWDGEEWIEVGLATLPAVRDTDGDGLSDGFEIRVSGTNPNDPDTDGDGWPDGVEVANMCLYQNNYEGYAEGAADLGDGSILVSNDATTPGVFGGVLRITEDNVNSQGAAYLLPRLGIEGSFNVSFDYALLDAPGDNPPADGFAFSFGNIADDAALTAEEGYGTGLSVEFDTWNNDGEGADNGIGIDVSVDGVDVALAREAAGADPNNNQFFVADGSSRHVEIIYSAGAAITGITETGLDGDAPAVVASGFGEDQLTFSDRTHQHNGAAFDDAGALSTAGTNIVPIPDYLVGGDYVQFANNARDNADYEATVTASGDVKWYLLIDNRVNGVAGDNSSPNTEDPVLGGTLQWVIDGGWERVNTGISPNDQADYTAVDEGGDGTGAGMGLNQFYAVYTLPASSSVTVKSNGIAGNNMISLVGVGSPNTVTVLQDGVAIHDAVAVDFVPSATDRIAFGARTGGANEGLTLDNLCVVEGTEAPAFLGDPNSDLYKGSPAEPIAFYDFEGDSVADKSGNGNDGEIVNNVTFGEGAPGSSTPTAGGRFSVGDTGHVNVPGVDMVALGQGDYSFAAWIKPFVDEPINGDHFLIGQTAQGIHHGIRGSGTLHTAHWGSDFNASTILTPDEWIHAVWTYDGSTNQARIYLNGELDGGPFNQNKPGGGNIAGNLVIGGRNGGEANFRGDVDDFLVFDEVLQINQIRDLAGGTAEGLFTLPGNIDSDADGISDGQENLAGTDPYDARDFFHVSGVSFGLNEDGSQSLLVDVATKPGMKYVLQFSPTLEAGTWENVDVMTAEEPNSAFEIMNPKAFQRREGFFRSILVEQN